jgi:tetratricopeptide (TPR) repeat protein
MHHKTAPRGTCIAAVLVLTASPVFGQTADEEALKKVIRAETESFYKRDADDWEATWRHEANVTRTMVAQSGYSTTTGWSSFGPETVKAFKGLKPIPLDLKTENYIIRTGGNLAWVEYDQYMQAPGADPKDRRFSREYRVLAKENGEWRIASQITVDPETFSPGQQAREAALNNIGYQLLGEKKVKEAIEVLKVNVTLNPQSSNVYDSLGEAYALDGDKRQAIANYEKAIALDPKRERSKAALAKLKE